MQVIAKPVVYKWGAFKRREIPDEPIDTDSIIDVIEWCNQFSGINRLSNDVSIPLERCVISAYQIGYLFDYVKIKDEKVRREYFEEGIASVLIHLIASYEMMGRNTCRLVEGIQTNSWNRLQTIVRKNVELNKEKNIFDNQIIILSENMFKYQRWVVYNHMKRTKRWNEEEFEKCFTYSIDGCMLLAQKFDCDLSNGFALAMSKIQDGEIKRH